MWVLLGIIGTILLVSIKQVDQFERGVKFQLGKFKKMVEPGWRIVLPVFQSMRKIDIRTKVIDVPEQDVISKDNISLRVSAVLYFKVSNAEKAALNVEDYRYAVSQLALTTMKTAVGEYKLDELLAEREAISNKIQAVVDKESTDWGLKVENVELKEIVLPEDMKRMIAKVAEAQREKQAIITKSEGEVKASENLAKAAREMAETPGALHLRTLSALCDISSDGGSTIIATLPMEFLEAMKGKASTFSDETITKLISTLNKRD